jgi:hypothetical protein
MRKKLAGFRKLKMRFKVEQILAKKVLNLLQQLQVVFLTAKSLISLYKEKI